MQLLSVDEGQLGFLRELARRAAELPDHPVAEAPPGRCIPCLDRASVELVLVAVEGLTLQVQAVLMTQRVGSAAYRETGVVVGRCVTIGNQLRRYLAAERSGSGADAEGQEDGSSEEGLGQEGVGAVP